MSTTIQHVEAFEETNYPVQALAMLTELGETDVKLEVDDEVAHLIYVSFASLFVFVAIYNGILGYGYSTN